MATFRRPPISWEGLRWPRSKANHSAAESAPCASLSPLELAIPASTSTVTWACRLHNLILGNLAI